MDTKREHRTHAEGSPRGKPCDLTYSPSGRLVLTNRRSNVTERVAARLGGGGLDAIGHAIGSNDTLLEKADLLYKQSLDQVNNRVLLENDLDCIMNSKFAKEEFGHWIDGIPYQMQAGVELNHDQFKDMVNSMLDDINRGQEKEVYFYHSDHLGSASWITDFEGIAVQHLQYMPYGEPYIDQRAAGTTYSERFRFTGKERDEETGYGYFGARYMDHELMTMWLSVDPMADKYPGISPYAYCAWNPVKLVDPDGRELYIPNSQSPNHEGSWKDLLSLLVLKGNSKYIQVGTDGKISMDFGNKTQKQIDKILMDDNGLNLLNMLVSSNKKYFYESSDDATSVYNDGMSHSMSNEHKGIINASNGGLDSRNAYTHTPKSGFDGHVILAKSGKWLRTNNNGFDQDLRRPILFHELAENYFRTDGLQNYELAHKSAKRLEGFSMHNHFPGVIPRATYEHPNQGYYFGGIHRF